MSCTQASTLTRRLRIVGFVLLAAAAFAAPQSIATRPTPQQDKRLLKHERTNLDSERRIALVIGNGAYTKAPPLKNPPNDATLLAATLRRLGFEVTTGVNKSQREMKQLIREFGQKLRAGGGVGLFYFAGHGVQAKGRNYLIPVDADIQTEADLEDVAVDVNYILSMMDDAQNALNIAILDACRNNLFARSFRSASEGLAQVKAPTGTLIAYATAPDSVAADGGGANSPYAEALTKQMQVSGVLLETMFRRVAEQVSSRSGGRQEPWYSANVKGDFYFSASAANSSGAAVKPAAQTRIDGVAVEREYWETIRNSNDAQDYKDYLQAYPSGAYTGIARAKVRQIESARNQPTNTSANSSGSATDRPTGAAKSNAPNSFKNRHGIELIFIPPGSFMMGSESGYANEKPIHQVTIREGFWMGKYEVTEAQWHKLTGRGPREIANSSLPIGGVDFALVQEFIGKLNGLNDGYTYRLQSEAEWEYAARAGESGDHPENLDVVGWHKGNSDNELQPVGRKQSNAFGLYDMFGNVFEWCQDTYQESYAGTATDGSARLMGKTSEFGVTRGCSLRSDITQCRFAGRNKFERKGVGLFIGFRVVAVERL